MALAAALILASALPARAQFATAQQVPFLELSAGYQLLRVSGDPGNTYPLGFAIAGTRYFGGRPFGIAVELGWSRDSLENPSVSATSNYFHIGGGPRFVLVRDGTLRPHVQLLGGLARASFKDEFSLPGQPLITNEGSDTAFMLQPGVGVTITGADSRLGLAIGIDYRRAFFDEGAGLTYSDTNEVRFFLGVRFGID
jgi:hypothetical protein